MKIFFKIVLIFFVLLYISCDDMKDMEHPQNNTGIAEPTEIFVLCEGLMNANNSSLLWYNLNTKQSEQDLFLKQNNRGLGDTGNDIAIYGSKIYVVLNTSSTVEIINKESGKSLKQLSLFNEKNEGRQPRHIVFCGTKAYVSCFDGYVVRIDTASMAVDATVKCGSNPDGICVANNKLYVANSGGLNFPNYDKTVSVIDLNTFTELKKIEVGINPTFIKADSENDVYLVSVGNYGSIQSRLQKINTTSNTLVASFDTIQATNLTIQNDTAYFYHFNYDTQVGSIKVFNCKTDKLISDNFITDNTQLQTPYGIDVNPFNGDVYVTDSKSYIEAGDVYCFTRNGKLKFSLKQIGVNPNKVVFK